MFGQTMVENIQHPKVADYFANQTEEIQALLHYFRKKVMDLHPLMREEFKWKLPFYCAPKAMVFLQVRKAQVEVGFIRGYKLEGFDHWLEGQHLKMVRYLIFDPYEDVDVVKLDTVLAAVLALYPD